ncbi:helix-turn-helix transcriptional regulator [Streptomyces fuscichromogenes]|uniref:HTH araC/xylS-type domain-containing protein n=1 Tax=Streptomyces fuscichromogenes TaxID=1324013 RepID=A0A918CW94_9ACTN|nr:helix-turn-helix transcriptional regulator [Streptomyces fuscichromogenes]GGN38792.1 hypothetical protein GCM10011578_084570 [Streptomyces fuscichromogenes]
MTRSHLSPGGSSQAPGRLPGFPPSGGDDRPDGDVKFRNFVTLTAQEIERGAQTLSGDELAPLSHLTGVSVPRSANPDGFRFDAQGHVNDGLLYARIYCGAMNGVSCGGTAGDPIVADVVKAGRISFVGEGGEYTVKPGQMFIRDTKLSWEFSCSASFSAHVISVPRHLVAPRVSSVRVLDRAYVADAGMPEVTFLLKFIEMIDENVDHLGVSKSIRITLRDAFAALISGIMSDCWGMESDTHASMTVAAARNVIERHLDSHDLSPRMVAQHIGVSLRTLHRSFSVSGESMMTFARRRRLQQAHDELVGTETLKDISALAARWHFSDSSHFIRHFKAYYGSTPGAYLRNRRTGDS